MEKYHNCIKIRNHKSFALRYNRRYKYITDQMLGYITRYHSFDSTIKKIDQLYHSLFYFDNPCAMLTLILNVQLFKTVPLPNKLESVPGPRLWVGCGNWTSFSTGFVGLNRCSNSKWFICVLSCQNVWHHNLVVIWQTIIIWLQCGVLLWPVIRLILSQATPIFLQIIWNVAVVNRQ